MRLPTLLAASRQPSAHSLLSNTSRLHGSLFILMLGLCPLLLYTELEGDMDSRGIGALAIPFQVPMALGTAAAVMRTRVAPFLLFAGAYLYYLTFGFPDNNTNQTLTFLVGLAIIGSAVGLMLARRSIRIDTGVLFDTFAPMVRLSVIAFYFWTVWHKLNFDFLNPAISCAPVVAEPLADLLGIDGASAAFRRTSVFGSLALELALPFGLSFRRTQRATALVGMVFHWVLGLADFYSFSVTMIALLGLFLPASDLRRLWPSNRWARLGVNTILLVHLALGLTGQLSYDVLHRGLWYLLGGTAVTSWLIQRPQEEDDDLPENLWAGLAHPRPLHIVPLLVFLNGLSPFVGFKTEYSFAMYSNLRTEGGRTNHVIWRTPLAWAPYQTDLVQLLDGTHPKVLESRAGRPITRYELRQAVSDLENAEAARARIVFEAGGMRYDHPAVTPVPDLMTPPRWWENRVLAFRRIVPPAPGECEH